SRYSARAASFAGAAGTPSHLTLSPTVHFFVLFIPASASAASSSSCTAASVLPPSRGPKNPAMLPEVSTKIRAGTVGAGGGGAAGSRFGALTEAAIGAPERSSLDGGPEDPEPHPQPRSATQA